MERNHTITIENLHAQQRIELQRLEDDSINFTRKLTTIQIEVTDSDRKLQALADQREQYEKQNELLRVSTRPKKVTDNSMHILEINTRDNIQV